MKIRLMYVVYAAIFAAAVFLGQTVNGQCGPGGCPKPPQQEQPRDSDRNLRAPIPALVLLEAWKGREGAVWSGFIADRNKKAGWAIIVTCAHACEINDKVVVTVQDGRSFYANILGLNKKVDVAIIQIRDPGIEPMKIADGMKYRRYTMMGYAHGNKFMESDGTYIGWFRQGEGKIQLSCRTVQGCSGGPIVNENGEVVATVTGYTTGGNTVGPCLSLILREVQLKTSF